jgi:hypothetical protein
MIALKMFLIFYRPIFHIFIGCNWEIISKVCWILSILLKAQIGCMDKIAIGCSIVVLHAFDLGLKKMLVPPKG